MRALYHRPGNHYHAVRDFNGQFPLRLRVGSLFPVMLQQGALLLCAPLVSSSKNKPTVKKGRGELTDMFWDNKRCMFFFFFFFYTGNYCGCLFSFKSQVKMSRAEDIVYRPGWMHARRETERRKLCNGASDVWCERKLPSGCSCHRLNASKGERVRATPKCHTWHNVSQTFSSVFSTLKQKGHHSNFSQ